MNTNELPTDSACCSITVINPFDGVDVGAVTNIPPTDAHAILRTASEGARACRECPGMSEPACSTLAHRWDLGGNAPVIVLGDCNLEDAVESWRGAVR